VLVVDDDPAVRRLTDQVLHREGWTVLQAENGRVGLRRVAESRPALIILDLLMPDMDGFEFLDALRRTDGCPAIPIIVLTAKDLTPADRDSLNGSVAKVLDKTVCNREHLLGAVREQIKARLVSQAVGASDRRMSRLLIVEDNEMNRDMLSRRLERKGYQVIMAMEGRCGLAAARSETPDLILMDMSLPEIDGWEVARQLKSDITTRSIPVIALTAHAMTSDRQKALEAGCDDYDTKPVEFQRLLTKIQAMLRSASSE
jgi:CheY-like chemotaxis protein